MTQAQSNAGTIGAALAANNVPNINKVDREQAALVIGGIRATVKARNVLKTKGEGMFGLIMAAAIAGATFGGMEQAEPDLLKDKAVNATYKPVKSMIEGARALGVSLVDAKGKPVTKAVLTHDSLIAKAKKAGVDTDGKTDKEIRDTLKGEKQDKNGKMETVAPRVATPQEIIESALSHLETSAEMREMFAGRIAAVARETANDAARRAQAKEDAAKTVRLNRAQKRAIAAAATQEARDALMAEYAAHGLTKKADAPQADAPQADAPQEETATA